MKGRRQGKNTFQRETETKRLWAQGIISGVGTEPKSQIRHFIAFNGPFFTVSLTLSYNFGRWQSVCATVVGFFPAVLPPFLVRVFSLRWLPHQLPCSMWPVDIAQEGNCAELTSRASQSQTGASWEQQIWRAGVFLSGAIISLWDTYFQRLAGFR